MGSEIMILWGFSPSSLSACLWASFLSVHRPLHFQRGGQTSHFPRAPKLGGIVILVRHLDILEKDCEADLKGPVVMCRGAKQDTWQGPRHVLCLPLPCFTVTMREADDSGELTRKERDWEEYWVNGEKVSKNNEQTKIIKQVSLQSSLGIIHLCLLQLRKPEVRC